MSDYAFPVHPCESVKQGDVTHFNVINPGLTKREYFAAMAMQGYLASGGTAWSRNKEYMLAELAVAHADALINVLDANKEGSGE